MSVSKNLQHQNTRYSFSVIKKKAWLLGKFITNSVSDFSADRGADSCGKAIPTSLKLTQKGLSRGDKSLPLQSLPYEFIDLKQLYDVYQDPKFANVLVCVVLSKITPDFDFEVYTYRMEKVSDILSFQLFFRQLTRRPEDWSNDRGQAHGIDNNNNSNRIYNNASRLSSNTLRKNGGSVSRLSRQLTDSHIYSTGRSNGWNSSRDFDEDNIYSTKKRPGQPMEQNNRSGSTLDVRRNIIDTTYQRSLPVSTNVRQPRQGSFAHQGSERRFDQEYRIVNPEYDYYPRSFSNVGVTANLKGNYRPLPGIEGELYCHRERVKIIGNLAVADVYCQANIMEYDDEFDTIASAGGGKGGNFYAKAWSLCGGKRDDEVDSYSRGLVTNHVDQVKVDVERNHNLRSSPVGRGRTGTTKQRNQTKGDEFYYDNGRSEDSPEPDYLSRNETSSSLARIILPPSNDRRQFSEFSTGQRPDRQQMNARGSSDIGFGRTSTNQPPIRTDGRFLDVPVSSERQWREERLSGYQNGDAERFFSLQQPRGSSMIIGSPANYSGRRSDIGSEDGGFYYEKGRTLASPAAGRMNSQARSKSVTRHQPRVGDRW